MVTGPIKQPLEICTLRLDSNNVFNMFNFIYAINVSIINKNTVYTRSGESRGGGLGPPPRNA